MQEHERIARYFAPLASAPGAAGLLDDVAELDSSGGRRVVTTDTLVENVHFLPCDPIDTVARKLVRVNVSDILAKGAHPREALLNLAWPPGRGEADLGCFAAALGAELDAWDARLIGGDSVTTSGPAVLSLTLTGACGPGGPVRRSGARAGHGLWVTGDIGAGVIGLRAVRGEIDDPEMAARYRLPALPAPAVADLVAAHASAAMDVSDGLVGDAMKLAQASGCGLELDLADIPFVRAPETRQARLELACGGDDYQVLLAAPADRRPLLDKTAHAAGLRLTSIGMLRDVAGLGLFDAGAPVAPPDRLAHEHA